MTIKVSKLIEYKEMFCVTCQEKASHVKVDTAEGKRLQCEICGSYNEGGLCFKCGSFDYQVSPEQLEKEDSEGFKKFGFYSFFECDKCGYRWLDD